jgi:hypothetical protein
MKKRTHNINYNIPRKNVELKLPEGRNILVSAPDILKMKEVVVDDRTKIYVAQNVNETEALNNFRFKLRDSMLKAIPGMRKKNNII